MGKSCMCQGGGGERHWMSCWGVCMLSWRLQWQVCFCPDIYRSQHFHSSLKIQFPSGIISLHPEKFPLAFLEMEIFWQQILFSFMWKMSLWKNIFAGYGILVDVFFYQHFKHVPLSLSSIVSDEKFVVIQIIVHFLSFLSRFSLLVF